MRYAHHAREVSVTDLRELPGGRYLKLGTCWAGLDDGYVFVFAPTL